MCDGVLTCTEMKMTPHTRPTVFLFASAVFRSKTHTHLFVRHTRHHGNAMTLTFNRTLFSPLSSSCQLVRSQNKDRDRLTDLLSL